MLRAQRLHASNASARDRARGCDAAAALGEIKGAARNAERRAASTTTATPAVPRTWRAAARGVMRELHRGNAGVVPRATMRLVGCARVAVRSIASAWLAHDAAEKEPNRE